MSYAKIIISALLAGTISNTWAMDAQGRLPSFQQLYHSVRTSPQRPIFYNGHQQGQQIPVTGHNTDQMIHLAQMAQAVRLQNLQMEQQTKVWYQIMSGVNEMFTQQIVVIGTQAEKIKRLEERVAALEQEHAAANK